MRRAAIVAPVRTAVGAYGGALRSVSSEDLAATVIRGVVGRSGIDPDRIDDVVLAQSYPNGEAPCIGRYAALHGGLPEEVPGMQLDRRCGGGLQAVVTAAMMVQTGSADAVIAGGVESMSNVEHYTTDLRWGMRSGGSQLHDRLDRARRRSQPDWRYGEISGMIETAENLAVRYDISRDAADAFALRSQQRAAEARSDGRFVDEIVGVEVPQRGAEPTMILEDEGIRPTTTLDGLARLRSILPDGVVTAGNASQQNDAAAACLVVAEDALDALGLEPMGYLLGWAVAGTDPAHMGIGPVPATAKLLARTGLDLDDFDLVEVNEAFAVQVLSVLKEWGWEDGTRLNVNGSGISLGHPIAATGARIMVTLLHELRRRGGRLGLETMCIGGGQGMAAAFAAV